MQPSIFALAIALLSMPPQEFKVPENPIHNTFIDTHFFLAPTMKQLALEWEIMDPREVRFILTRKENFVGDIKLLQKRYQDLKDAPPLHECMFFPDRALVNDLLSFNRNYRQHLDKRSSLELTHWWEFHEVLREVDRLYHIWDLVRDARCEYYYVTVRRQALKKLKEAIGEDAYYNGNLPPHVPVWRFVPID